jgi:hypothetical protein
MYASSIGMQFPKWNLGFEHKVITCIKCCMSIKNCNNLIYIIFIYSSQQNMKCDDAPMYISVELLFYCKVVSLASYGLLHG